MEQIVNYLMFHQEKVKYPVRTAIFIRNHPYMTQLDFSTCKRHKRYSGRNSSSNMLRQKQHGRWVYVLQRLRLDNTVVAKIKTLDITVEV